MIWYIITSILEETAAYIFKHKSVNMYQTT